MQCYLNSYQDCSQWRPQSQPRPRRIWRLTVLFGEGYGDISQSNGNEIVVNTEGENIEGQTESPTTEPPTTTVADVVTVPFVQKFCDMGDHIKYASYRVRDYSLAKEKETEAYTAIATEEDCCTHIISSHTSMYS